MRLHWIKGSACAATVLLGFGVSGGATADEITLVRPGAAPVAPDPPPGSTVLRGTRPANPVPSQPAGEGIGAPPSASAPGSGCPFGYDCSGKDSDFDRSGLNPRY